MKILILSTSNQGGAGLAAQRLYDSLKSRGFEVYFCFSHKFYTYLECKDFKKIIGFNYTHFIKLFVSIFLKFFNKNKYYIPISFNIFPTFLLSKLKKMNFDVYHLNWIGQEFIGLNELTKLENAIVTLHDSWYFLGINHIPDVQDITKFIYQDSSVLNSLNISNSPLLNKIDNLIYSRKSKMKSKNIIFTSPSSWLSTNFTNSFFGTGKEIKVIPNIIANEYIKLENTNYEFNDNYKSSSSSVLYFVAANPFDYNKGLDLFLETTKLGLKFGLSYNIVCNPKFRNIFEINKNFFYLSPTTKISKMISYYSQNDMCLISSRIENAPQIAIESLLVGTPVIAFDIPGMREIVAHKVNGYLADPFSSEDLLNGINWIVEHKNQLNRLYIIKTMKRNFNNETTLNKYINLYQRISNEF